MKMSLKNIDRLKAKLKYSDKLKLWYGYCTPIESLFIVSKLPKHIREGMSLHISRWKIKKQCGQCGISPIYLPRDFNTDCLYDKQ